MPPTLLRSRELFSRSVRELFTSWPVVAALVLGLGVVGCASSEGAGTAGSVAAEPAPETTGETTGGESEDVQPAGFRTIEARVTSADGEVCELCLWLADTADARSTGLMGVTDLGGADGMVFTWGQPVQSNFVMIGTPTPLSIAWFADDGEFVSATDMEPCLDADPSTCARYPAEGPYTAALEVFQGELDVLGVGPGARFELVPGTEAATCASAT